MSESATYHFQTIGIIHSPYKEKFAVPRQPGLVPGLVCNLELLPPYNSLDAVAGLEQVSHIWVHFVFHKSLHQTWRPKVRPPRLGGNRKLGVFASRSPVRPNPIGLSVMKIESLTTERGKVVLNLSGGDLVDGTPVLDIKPYLPYADIIAEAHCGFADTPPPHIDLRFSSQAREQCRQLEEKSDKTLSTVLTQILQQDPRPQYHDFDPKRIYGFNLSNLNVRWRYVLLAEQSAPTKGGWCIEVLSITEAELKQ